MKESGLEGVFYFLFCSCTLTGDSLRSVGSRSLGTPTLARSAVGADWLAR